jgi:hypothetical protein
MARKAAKKAARRPAKSTPGTERYRDERRSGGGPRMHGRKWHDHDNPRDLEPAGASAAETITEGEHGGAHAGMGRVRANAKTSQGRVRRKRTAPVTKGTSRKPGAPKKISQSGKKGRGRA